MAKRKIIWTKRANLERKEILKYWEERNKSKTYSVKLNRLFIETVKNISDMPMIGRQTDFDKQTRLIIVRDYLLFYRFSEYELKVLAVLSGYRNDLPDSTV